MFGAGSCKACKGAGAHREHFCLLLERGAVVDERGRGGPHMLLVHRAAVLTSLRKCKRQQVCSRALSLYPYEEEAFAGLFSVGKLGALEALHQRPLHACLQELLSLQLQYGRQRGLVVSS